MLLTLHEINDLIKLIHGKAYIVGGAVRDEILNMKSHDLDLVVVGVRQNDFECIFPQAEMTGKSFPVYRIRTSDYGEVEIAFARKERKVSLGHNGFEVIFDPSVTLKEDLYRRDLTMNALAKDIDTDQIIDYFNGVDDIKNKVISVVSEHFLEDPLRALRAARLAARFNFNISSKTYEMMHACKRELTNLSQDRIVGELEKALATPSPSIFFNSLKEVDILDVTFPFISSLIKQNVYVRSIEILDEVSSRSSDIATRFSALSCYVNVFDIEKLPSAYSNLWKKMASVTNVFSAKLSDGLTDEEIVDSLNKFKRNNLNINEISLIVKAKLGSIPWFLNNSVFASIMNMKFDIPKTMTNGEQIKQFVKEQRVKKLQSMKPRFC